MIKQDKLFFNMIHNDPFLGDIELEEIAEIDNFESNTVIYRHKDYDHMNNFYYYQTSYFRNGEVIYNPMQSIDKKIIEKINEFEGL